MKIQRTSTKVVWVRCKTCLFLTNLEKADEYTCFMCKSEDVEDVTGSSNDERLVMMEEYKKFLRQRWKERVMHKLKKDPNSVGELLDIMMEYPPYFEIIGRFCKDETSDNRD